MIILICSLLSLRHQAAAVLRGNTGATTQQQQQTQQTTPVFGAIHGVTMDPR